MVVKVLKTNKKENILKAPGGREDPFRIYGHTRCPSLLCRNCDLFRVWGGGAVNPEFFILPKYPLRIKVK